MRAEFMDNSQIPVALHTVMSALAGGGVALAAIIRRGDAGLAAQVGINADGDAQKALDLQADAIFAKALRGTGVRWYASEERDDAAMIDDGGALAVAIDPLDGSSNIDTNTPVGTIFSVFPVTPDIADDPEASFLRPPRQQLAGGYIIYGPRVCMMVTFGDGTLMYTLNHDTGRFDLTQARVALPARSQEFAINASNYRHWSQPIRAYIDDLVSGAEGPRGANFNMRWIASLVAEAHRILMRGGIFLYPADDRPGYDRGRLRHVYECAPIAFLIEQAGGRATDGCNPVMDQVADHLHQRIPFVFGSAEKVDRVAAYHDLPDPEVSALFGNRGLFRA